MSAEQLALVRGWDDTREVLRSWSASPGQVVVPWTIGSLLITSALLLATWAVATLSDPDLTPVLFPGVNLHADAGEYARVLKANGLVLALHAMACVAGFIAGSSLPQAAQGYTGAWRWVHDKAGPLAMAFVVGATAFSLATQAYALGGAAATMAAQLDISPALLLLGLLPHALPELVALFLPLAAWTLASRRAAWHQLLAATFVTVAIAVPVLLASAAVEVWATSHLLLAIAN